MPITSAAGLLASQWKKAEREDKKRLQHTLDVKNDVINAVRRSDDATVDAQLADDWMRD